MKNLVTLLFICLSTLSFSQTDSTKSTIGKYICGGISLTNGDDFLSSTFASVEGGICKDNFSMGLALGRGSLSGIDNTDNIRNYYYEVKVYGGVPMGILTGNLILGYGGYIDTKHMFIEYGFGLSYTKNTLTYGVAYSNWDGVNYVSPSIMFNF